MESRIKDKLNRAAAGQESLSLRCQHPTGATVQLPLAPLPAQLLANVSGKATANGPNA